MPTHCLDVMQLRQHCAPFAMPALHDGQQVGGGLGIQGGERFVQQDQVGILQQEPREHHALHLTTRKSGDRAMVKTVQANGRQRLGHPPAILGTDRTEGSDPMPQAHCDKGPHGDRKASIHF